MTHRDKRAEMAELCHACSHCRIYSKANMVSPLHSQSRYQIVSLGDQMCRFCVSANRTHCTTSLGRHRRLARRRVSQKYTMLLNKFLSTIGATRVFHNGQQLPAWKDPCISNVPEQLPARCFPNHQCYTSELDYTLSSSACAINALCQTSFERISIWNSTEHIFRLKV